VLGVDRVQGEMDRGRVFGRERVGLLGGVGCQRLGLLGLRQGDVVSDSVEPRAEASGVLEPPDRPEHAKPDFLEHVERPLVVPEESAHVIEQGPLHLLDQGFERIGSPALTSECQPLVPCQTRRAPHGHSCLSEPDQGDPVVRPSPTRKSYQAPGRFNGQVTKLILPAWSQRASCHARQQRMVTAQVSRPARHSSNWVAWFLQWMSRLSDTLARSSASCSGASDAHRHGGRMARSQMVNDKSPIAVGGVCLPRTRAPETWDPRIRSVFHARR
jgi:hypothetical protein